MAETQQSSTSRLEQFAASTAAAVFVALLLVACGGAPQSATAGPRIQEHVTHQPPQTVARIFDPAKHRADDISQEIDQIIRSIPPPATDEPDGYDLSGSPDDTTQTITNGYRVQVYMSTRRENAERQAAIARQRFPEDNVYVVFQGAFHRVRIGDYRTEAEAREKVREARRKGYSEPLWLPPESND